MSDIYMLIMYVLKGIPKILLYSVILAVVLLILYFLGHYLFEKLEKRLSWMWASLITSILYSIIIVIIMYFYPFVFFGWKFKLYDLAITFGDYSIITLKQIWHIFYVAIIYGVLAQPFIILFSYIKNKLNINGQNIPKLYLAHLILAIIIMLLIVIFPWVLPGLIFMVYY